ncbi:MAG: hypothetical protein AAFO91_10100, partial [Bacteroidota bacterium]
MVGFLVLQEGRLEYVLNDLAGSAQGNNGADLVHIWSAAVFDLTHWDQSSDKVRAKELERGCGGVVQDL